MYYFEDACGEVGLPTDSRHRDEIATIWKTNICWKYFSKNKSVGLKKVMKFALKPSLSAHSISKITNEQKD